MKNRGSLKCIKYLTFQQKIEKGELHEIFHGQNPLNCIRTTHIIFLLLYIYESEGITIMMKFIHF